MGHFAANPGLKPGRTVRGSTTRSPLSDAAAASVDAGPTVRRIGLGTRLRRLREDAGISRRAATVAIDASLPKLSRLEAGRGRAKRGDVIRLLEFYEADVEEREHVLGLVDLADAPSHWQQYADVLPAWFETFLGLEQAAAVIRAYQPQFVPGLLQSEAYARSVIELAHGEEPTASLDHRVALRMDRQRATRLRGAPKLWAVVDEAVLRRPIGTRAVHRDQLRHLLALSDDPQVSLQIVPFELGGYASIGAPFSLLRFDDPDVPDVVYLEQLAGAVYLDRRADVDHYLDVLDRTCTAAPSPGRTPTILRQVLQQI